MEATSWKTKYALFLSSQTISLLGSSLVTYAISWYVTLETGSGLMMALSIIFGFVPTFLLSPLAGVWADCYNRKALIMGADLGIALVTMGLFAYFSQVNQASIWALFIASAFRSVGTAIQSPAVSAVIVQLVPEDKLMRANGLQSTFQSAIVLISPLLSGILMGVIELRWIFLIDGVTCLIAVAIFSYIHVERPAHAKEKQYVGYWHDLRSGFVYIREHEYVRSLFMFFALFFVLVSPAAFLSPLQIARSYGADVWRLMVMEAAFSTGMLLGGILISSWGGFKNRALTMVISVYLIGVNQVLLGAIHHFWIYNFIMLIVGITLPVFNTPAITLLQEKVDPVFTGRVFGVLGMISSGFMPMGILFFGPLADQISIELQLVVTGSLLIVLAFVLQRNSFIQKSSLAPDASPESPVL